jgi:large subunit ribosomal protein L30
MICVIRIAGQINLKSEIKETLKRLRIYKKLNACFIDEKDAVKMGMLKKVKDFVAYGNVSDELMKKVIEARGQKDKKSGEYKGYCRLHPPVGGFKKSTKRAVNQKGILGKHEDISKLLERMV